MLAGSLEQSVKIHEASYAIKRSRSALGVYEAFIDAEPRATDFPAITGSLAERNT